MSEEQRALVALRERRVNFYGDHLVAVVVEEEAERRIYVPIRRIVEYLGLAWSSQLQRVKRDEDLAEGLRNVLLMQEEVGQHYEVACLRLEYLPGFLFGITTSKVREDLQPQVKRYKRECYRVLWEAFWRGELFTEEDELLPPPAQTVVAAADPLAVVMVEHQQETLALLQDHDQQTRTSQTRIEAKLDHAVDLLTGFLTTQQARVDKIDERTQRLTPKHALQVSNAIDRLCKLWRKRSPHLTEEQAKSWAYSRIHQRFQTTSYKEIADERINEVLAYLRKAIARASDGQEPEQDTLFNEPE